MRELLALLDDPELDSVRTALAVLARAADRLTARTAGSSQADSTRLPARKDPA